MYKVTEPFPLANYWKSDILTVFFFPATKECFTATNPPNIFSMPEYIVAVWKIKWKS
jgi:hypothetical protein